MSAPEPPGLAWPRDAAGRRSSAAAGREIVGAALRVLDPAAADALDAERDWRHAYPRHLRRLVELQALRPGALLASSRAGLEAAWERLRFVPAGPGAGASADADGIPLAEAVGAPRARAPGGAPAAPRAGPHATPHALATTTLRGDGPAAPARWEVPYRGQRLHGEALARQIDRWQAAGVAEAGHCEALRRALAHPEWFDLSDRTLVLLGAGSEAGPLPWLARWRARLVAVDLPRPAPWRRIAAAVRAGNATLVAPRAADAPDDIAACGADLVGEAPAIAAWLAERHAQGRQPLDIGQFAYADGERHVRVVLAMDAVGVALTHLDPRTSLAYLATPTDLFAVPEAIARAIRTRHDARPLPLKLARAALRAGSGGRGFVPHVAELLRAEDGRRWGVVDAVVVQQGPNYLLAKRLQQWRAWVARAAGQRVSISVAPSTATASVVSNRLLAAGFRGARAFDVEVFEPATTSALMAALWVHDLRQDPPAAADPQASLAALAEGANHGGLWRVPYLPRSVLPLAALLGLLARQ